MWRLLHFITRSRSCVVAVRMKTSFTFTHNEKTSNFSMDVDARLSDSLLLFKNHLNSFLSTEITNTDQLSLKK